MSNIMNILSRLNDHLNYNYQHDNIDRKSIKMLYDLLVKGDKYVQKKKNDTCFNYNLINISLISQIPMATMGDTSFFPNEIKTYINDNACYALQFNCNIKERNINISFIICDKLDSDKVREISHYVYIIYMWIYILHDLSSIKCSKDLDLYLYLTPFTKLLPENQLITLDAKHVNSGYTTGCKSKTEIVIFRQEEWFKVFIHETFHCFGLDFSDMNLSSASSKLLNIFNLKIEYNIYESYCETWARIINTMFYSYLFSPKSKKMDYKYFIDSFNYNMQIESKHSLYQCIKILSFMDLTFNTITDKSPENITACNHLYRENTSVCSYYIVTGLLVNNYNNFISWCDKNNNSLVKFRKTPSNIDKYIELIQKTTKNSHIKKNIKKLENGLINKTYVILPEMNMTILNINNQILF
jgi:hypothetical protein